MFLLTPNFFWPLIGLKFRTHPPSNLLPPSKKKFSYLMCIYIVQILLLQATVHCMHKLLHLMKCFNPASEEICEMCQYCLLCMPLYLSYLHTSENPFPWFMNHYVGINVLEVRMYFYWSSQIKFTYLFFKCQIQHLSKSACRTCKYLDKLNPIHCNS